MKTAIKVFEQNNFWVSEILNLDGLKNQLGQIPTSFKFYGVSSSSVYDQAIKTLKAQK